MNRYIVTMIRWNNEQRWNVQKLGCLQCGWADFFWIGEASSPDKALEMAKTCAPGNTR